MDGQEVLAQFDADTKTLNLDARSGVITAQATNNASVTVLDAVNGTAKVLFRPENGDENKAQEYTVNFKQSETPEEDHSKDGLKAVIDLAEKLNAENYTAMQAGMHSRMHWQQQKKSAMQKMQPWKK